MRHTLQVGTEAAIKIEYQLSSQYRRASDRRAVVFLITVGGGADLCLEQSILRLQPLVARLIVKNEQLRRSLYDLRA